MHENQNLFVALREGLSGRLDHRHRDRRRPGAPLFYTWRDIERATAMIANLFDLLGLPAGARVAVQTEKSGRGAAALPAVLRAGYVYPPLNTAYQAAEIE